MTELDGFTLETFTQLVGSSFTILGNHPREADAGSPPELELIEATSLGGAEATEREPFSLLFLERSSRALADETYRVEHPALGSFELFVVPIAQDADGVRYEAIFN